MEVEMDSQSIQLTDQPLDEDGEEEGSQTFTLTTDDGITYVFQANVDEESGTSLADQINQLRVYPSEEGPTLDLSSGFTFSTLENSTTSCSPSTSEQELIPLTDAANENEFVGGGDTDDIAKLPSELNSSKNAVGYSDLTLWPLAKTEALLSAMGKYQNMFRGGLKRRKRIWECVSKEFARSSGHTSDRDECSKKWHNLYRTYKKVHDRQGNDSTWELYKQVKDLVKALNWPNLSSIPKKKPSALRTNKGIDKFMQTIQKQNAQRKACVQSFIEKVNVLENEKHDLIDRIGQLLGIDKGSDEVYKIVAEIRQLSDMGTLIPKNVHSHQKDQSKAGETRKISDINGCNFQKVVLPNSEIITQQNGSFELGVPCYILTDFSANNLSGLNRSLISNSTPNAPYYYLRVTNDNTDPANPQYEIICADPDENNI